LQLLPECFDGLAGYSPFAGNCGICEVETPLIPAIPKSLALSGSEWGFTETSRIWGLESILRDFGDSLHPDHSNSLSIRVLF
jgi:hypothetical protein